MSATRQRILLAALLLAPGQAVSGDRLADLVWDGQPPRGAAVTLRTHIKRLRQVLGPSGRAAIISSGSGYGIQATGDEIDIAQFETNLRLGEAAARSGAWRRAADMFGLAQALWRGAPLADVPCRELQLAEVPRLEEQCLQAIQGRIEADLQLGRCGQVVPELQALTAEHPLREPFHGQLMVALYRSGRQADALAAFRAVRGILISEIGVEPGAELRLIHERILAGDRELRAAPTLGPARMGGQVPPAIRQLPPAVAHFAGREAELKELTALPGSGKGTVVAVLDGTAGVGKTALAVHWAYQVAGLFPDGQLYLNLNGFGPAGHPRSPADAVRSILEVLQVPAARVPASIEGRIGLYRSLLAERRMLIVLDNARDADQVRPLLPGGTGCMVLITSRAQLTGLVALEGARASTLGVLSRAEARQMVAQRLGAACAAADQEATDLLADACARLPLALAIATALIATCPGYSIISVARELTQAAHGLDTLDAGEVTANLRAVIDWSYEALTPPAARMFCLLAEHPGPDIAAPAAASLTATGADQARNVLLELVKANLVTENGAGRFAFHDLLRQYAASRLQALHSPADRAAACYRMLDHYLQTATAAALIISPGRTLPGLQPPSAGTQPELIASQDDAFAWLCAEHAVLMRVTTYAAEAGADAHACQIPQALTDFHDRTGHWHDWAAGQRIALAAAQRLGDISAQASAHRYIGRACFHLQHHDQAVDHLTRSLELQHHLDQPAGEAGISIDLGRMHEQRGNHAEALQSAQRALALYEAIKHRVGVAVALNSVGWYYALLGRYPDGLRYCERSLEQAIEIGHRVIEAQAWDSIGFIHQHMTQPVQAITCHQRSVERLRELGDRHQLTRALNHLGDAHRAAGDHDAAMEAWVDALTILDDLDHPDADEVRAKIAADAGGR